MDGSPFRHSPTRSRRRWRRLSSTSASVAMPPEDFLNSDILWAAVGEGTDKRGRSGDPRLGRRGPRNVELSAGRRSDRGLDGGYRSLPEAPSRGRTAPAGAAGRLLREPQPRGAADEAEERLAGQLQLAGRRATELPGVIDNFSIRWTGYVKVTTAGNYRFGACRRRRRPAHGRRDARSQQVDRSAGRAMLRPDQPADRVA